MVVRVSATDVSNGIHKCCQHTEGMEYIISDMYIYIIFHLDKYVFFIFTDLISNLFFSCYIIFFSYSVGRREWISMAGPSFGYLLQR